MTATREFNLCLRIWVVAIFLVVLVVITCYAVRKPDWVFEGLGDGGGAEGGSHSVQDEEEAIDE